MLLLHRVDFGIAIVMVGVIIMLSESIIDDRGIVLWSNVACIMFWCHRMMCYRGGAFTARFPRRATFDRICFVFY